MYSNSCIRTDEIQFVLNIHLYFTSFIFLLIYYFQILKVLCETAVAVRTKALKCLTAVIEADPAILARVSMKVLSFIDKSVSYDFS